MAKKYSDIVTLRHSTAAYNIQNEAAGDWSNFIANEQFNDILKKVISSVYNNEADVHKSFWIEGTYGTGKSHAGAVIKHLLCDKVSDIEEYVNMEYADAKFSVLKEQLLDLRSKKRLFPVMLYGKSDIAHEDDLSLQVQKAVKEALVKAGLDITVKTDFDTYVDHVEAQPGFWDLLIRQNVLLASHTPTRKKLLDDLRKNDMGTLDIVKQVLREGKYNIMLDNAKLAEWFFEVQDKLAATTEYNGILLIWDEFTDVMTSEIGLSLLVKLQEIAEGTMNAANNSYLLFISHPSALNSLRAEEREKTKGRYHYMKYNMEPVSAFKIMSRKFEIVGSRQDYEALSNRFYANREYLLDAYASSSNNPEGTKNDIKNLFPLHPSTANLATFYAREAGSSSRSVFQFLGDNPGVRAFFDSEEAFAKHRTITADYLWDYVEEEFNGNVSKYGAVTERFNSFRSIVASKGEGYLAVFKGILLLNALNNIANNDTVTPSEENITNLFAGTEIEDQMETILAYFNDGGIIQRSPSGIYSIQFSALPTKEIEEIKQQVATTQFRYTSQILNFDDTASTEFDKTLSSVNRPCSFKFYSVDTNGATLQSKIENGRKEAKSYELFLALMFARNAQELNEIKDLAQESAKDSRFANVVFFVFESLFTDKCYERFIEYQANATCAQQHGFADQHQSHLKCAKDMIKEWLKEVRRGNATYYFRDKEENDYSNVCATARLSSTINLAVAPVLFSSGPESLEIIRISSSKTYWKKASVRDTVKNVLLFHTKGDIVSHCGGPAKHVEYLLQDSVDDNLEWKQGIDPHHPLFQVCNFVKRKIDSADKSSDFNLAEKFADLTKPPYGLFQSYAGMAMLAFALRPYAGKIFDQNGKPREAQHLVEDVVEVFKCWEDGKSANKVNFMFETPEAGSLCKQFVSAFKLNEFKEYSDISSLKDARWVITHEYAQAKGYPLWSLKYFDVNPTNMASEAGDEENINRLIDDVLSICSEAGHQNPSLLCRTIDEFKSLNFDFANLLNTEGAFRKGFVNFLKAEENVNLKDKDVDSAIDYVKKHQQHIVGMWTENEVKDALKNWKLSLPTVIVNPVIDGKTEDVKGPTLPDITSPVFQKKKEQAKSKVHALNDIQQARQLLEKLCDLGYDDILDLINS